MLLKDAFNSLYTAVWKQCTETKNLLLIHVRSFHD
jgi:hypothetical protein